MKEIDDNEIRIIGSTDRGRRRRWPWYGWLAVGLVLAALVAVAVATTKPSLRRLPCRFWLHTICCGASACGYS